MKKPDIKTLEGRLVIYRQVLKSLQELNWFSCCRLSDIYRKTTGEAVFSKQIGIFFPEVVLIRPELKSHECFVGGSGWWSHNNPARIEAWKRLVRACEESIKTGKSVEECLTKEEK